MLEPVRSFAQTLLDAGPQATPTRDRHARWVGDLVREAEIGVQGAAEPLWSIRLDEEHGNLRAAVRYAIAAGAVARCGDLIAPLYWYVWSGAHLEAGAWARDALAIRSDTKVARLPDVCAVAANAAWQQGDLASAAAFAQAGVDSVDGDPATACRALDAAGDVHVLRGEHDEAKRCYRAAIEGARVAGDGRQAAISASNLALAHAYAGDADAGVRLADEARAIAERTGNPSSIAFATFTRGEVVLDAAPDDALPLLDEAVAMAERAGNRFVRGVAALSAVSLAARAGNPDDALQRFGPLLDHWLRIGAWTQLWTTVRALAETLTRSEQSDTAAILYGAVRGAQRSAPLIGADVARVRESEAALRERLGDARFERLTAQGIGMAEADAVTLARAACGGDL